MLLSAAELVKHSNGVASARRNQSRVLSLEIVREEEQRTWPGQGREPSHSVEGEPVSKATRCMDCLLSRLWLGLRPGGVVDAQRAGTARVIEQLEEAEAEEEERAKAQKRLALEHKQHSDRPKAIAALRMAKMLQASAEQKYTAVVALEEQALQIENACATASITRAMNKNVKMTRKTTKGLLGQVDKASDGVSELADTSQEVSESLGAITAGFGGYDEDELLRELEALGEDDGDGAAETHARAASPAPDARQRVSFPSAPTPETTRECASSDVSSGARAAPDAPRGAALASV